MEKIWGPIRGFYIAAYSIAVAGGERYWSYAKVCPGRPSSYWEARSLFKLFGGEDHASEIAAIAFVRLAAQAQIERIPERDVELLGFAHQAEWGPAFHAALPVEGESGTLKRHGRATPSRGNLHAKTGTTDTVAALGGYVTAKNGEVLAFSLIYNGSDRGNAKAAMDQIGATMAEFVRE